MTGAADGVSRGVPDQWLPENQDESVKYMTIATDVYTVDDEGKPVEIVDVEELVIVSPNGPAIPADEAPEVNAEPDPIVPADPVPAPVPTADDGYTLDDDGQLVAPEPEEPAEDAPVDEEPAAPVVEEPEPVEEPVEEPAPSEPVDEPAPVDVPVPSEVFPPAEEEPAADAAPEETPATDDPVNDVEAPVEAEPEEATDVPSGEGL